MTDSRPADPPSAFVETWARALVDQVASPRRALDVAMGRGRHAVVLAEAGFHVFGVDHQEAVVRSAVDRVRAHGHRVSAWCADLTRSPLPIHRFDLVVVTRYLQRNLFPALVAALADGGTIIYETFTEAQRQYGRGPTSPDHLLAEGELRTYFEELELIFYEEVRAPEAVARIVARRAARAS